MTIDHRAVGHRIEPTTVAWTSKDSLLYALAVGCGTGDLQFCTENSRGIQQRALPTFAVTIYDMAINVLPALGPIDTARLIHGEQSLVLHKPIPPQGNARIEGGIEQIYDKGSAALVWIGTHATDPDDGTPLFDLKMGIFIPGEGGWGGERGSQAAGQAIPERAPDSIVSYETRPEQALLYRLTGDRNPLHSDPLAARANGFEKPLLHGLCTFGFTGRALVAELCDNDPARLRGMQARFSAPTWPGDPLSISIWKTDRGEAMFSTSSTDGIVIDRGLCRYAG